MPKMIVPCDVAIRRYYRLYVEAEEGAGEEVIKAKAIEMLTDGTDIDTVLTPDPDLETEEQDICWITPDFEGSWSEEDEAEFKELFSRRPLIETSGEMADKATPSQ